jgi:hypothetical protein
MNAGSRLAPGAPNPYGGCQEGSYEVDIFCHFVDIFTVGNLSADIGTYIVPFM